MINVVQYEDEYRITFPFDYKIKELVKSIPGRRWNPDGKYWTIPQNHLGMLINTFTGTEYQDMVSIKSKELINTNQSLDATREIPNVSLKGIKLYVKSGHQLYDHQKDFMRFAIHRQNNGNMNGFICCDLMGLGKSLESINLALYNKSHNNFKHCLIICCINMSKYNWLNEIYEQTNGKFEGYILGSRKNKSGKINYNGSSKNKLEDLQLGFMYGDKSGQKLPYFLILNIEAIRMKDKRKYLIADELINYIKSDKLNMIIIDEVHKNVSPTSQQGKQILRIKKSTGKKCMWIPMTGTPIVNQPTDLFVPLRLIEAHSINSYYNWNQTFCVFGGFGGHEIIGYKNMNQLKSLLQGNMIRRLKEDVLDLPEKIEIIEYVQNTAYQDKWMKIIEADILSHKDEIVASLNPLAKMLKLRQVNGSPELVDTDLQVDAQYIKKNAKLQRLIELVSDILARDEKVVIFSNWVEPLRTVYKHLAAKWKVCCFTGTMKEKDRQQHKDTFLNNPNYKIMIGTIGALGTTHTLTAANNIIFYDEPWTAADRQQACDRCLLKGSRIATPKGFVPIEDLNVGDLVYTPQGNVKRILDCWNHRELADLRDIRFYGNPESITLTFDHKVLLDDGWVKAQDIQPASSGSQQQTSMMEKVSDKLKITRIPTNFDPKSLYMYNNFGAKQRIGKKYTLPDYIELTSDFLFFCGYYLGDGCACKIDSPDGGQIQLAGNKTTKLEHLIRCKVWFESTLSGTATLKYEPGEKQGVTLYITSKSFNNFIVELLGRTKLDKHLPNFIYELNFEQLSRFYEGLCASDGYLDNKSKTNVSQVYSTTTPALASGVWWIQSRLGYRPRIEIVKSKNKNHNDVYVISHTINPNYRLKSGRIRKYDKRVKEVDLYDITVEDDEAFYVWGTPVHNCHRIGTTKSTNVYTLLCKDTIDERVHKILYSKEIISNFMVDDKIDIYNNPELFDILLGREK